MYCNCSSKNNYEVIALCDIKKFTDKNGPFNLISYTGDHTVNDVNYVDYAIAKINSDLAYSTDIDFIGKIKGNAFPNLNKEVIKVGKIIMLVVLPT